MGRPRPRWWTSKPCEASICRGYDITSPVHDPDPGGRARKKPGRSLPGLQRKAARENQPTMSGARSLGSRPVLLQKPPFELYSCGG